MYYLEVIDNRNLESLYYNSLSFFVSFFQSFQPSFAQPSLSQDCVYAVAEAHTVFKITLKYMIIVWRVLENGVFIFLWHP